MRSPRHSVVVEYKNKRSRKGKKTLWGNIDLTAFSDDAENALPEVAKPPVQVTIQASDNPVRILPALKPEVTLSDRPDPVTTSAPAESAAAQPAEIPLADAPAPADVADVTVAETLETPKVSPPADLIDNVPEATGAAYVEVPLVPAAKPRRVKRKAARSTQRAQSLQVTDMDELEQLEAENLRLKHLLQVRLDDENAQLRAMIAASAERASDLSAK